MKFAYADPPYLGQAQKHYSADALCCEVNHRILINTLELEYSDGWALSCSSPSLLTILPMCPPRARVMAWVKPFCSFKPGVGVAYAWEPVIVCGGRPRSRAQDTARDWVSANITLQRGLTGAKPLAFCYWLFEVLNLEASDELADIFPGSGAVSQAWEIYRSRLMNEPTQLTMIA